MFVINHKKIFFTLSGILAAFSVSAIIFFGFNFGIDFKGGAITEIAYLNSQEFNFIEIENEIKSNLQKLDLGVFVVQETAPADQSEVGGIILRTKALTEQERQTLISTLSQNGKYQIEEKRYNSIGPAIGEELRKKALWAILVVILAIILFISFAFRKVAEANSKDKVSSWKYGLVAIIALAHDIIIPTGVYACLGHFFIDCQINTVFIMAVLAILGYSVNDTIVVFDRIRENLAKAYRKTFDEIVGMSLKQTITRSINTSVTTLAVLLSLYFLGGDATKQFALILSMGVIIGTYSSIFLASPLLTIFYRNQK